MEARAISEPLTPKRSLVQSPALPTTLVQVRERFPGTGMGQAIEDPTSWGWQGEQHLPDGRPLLRQWVNVGDRPAST